MIFFSIFHMAASLQELNTELFARKGLISTERKRLGIFLFLIDFIKYFSKR